MPDVASRVRTNTPGPGGRTLLLALVLAFAATPARPAVSARPPAPAASFRHAVLVMPRPDFRLPDTTVSFAPLETKQCLRCHGIPGFLVRDSVGGPVRDLSVHVAAFSRSEHRALACTQCHGDIRQYPHELTRPRPRVGCGADCHARDAKGKPVRHEDTVEAYEHSVHAGGITGRSPDSPDCAYCHGGGDPHAIARATRAYSAVQRTAMCATCHEDAQRMRRRRVDAGAVETWRQSVHASLLRLGERDSPACGDCHDVHGVRASRDTASSTAASHLPRTCGRDGCHKGASAAFAGSGTSHPGMTLARHPRLSAMRTGLGRFGGGVLLAMAAGVLLDAQRRLLRRRRRDRGPTPGGALVERLPVALRLQHGALIASFVTLALTGLPLRFPASRALAAMAKALGGPDALRIAHRSAGAVLAVVLAVHLWRALAALVRARGRVSEAWSMWPTRADVREAWDTLRFDLRLRPTLPAYDRHHFREKAHYFAVLWGVPAMTLTGLVLWLGGDLAGRVPAGALAAATLMHADEALLAIGITIVWHMYQVHVAPGAHHRFLTWIDGRITRAHWLVQHPREARRAGEALDDATRTRLHEESLGAAREAQPSAGSPRPPL